MKNCFVKVIRKEMYLIVTVLQGEKYFILDRLLKDHISGDVGE